MMSNINYVNLYNSFIAQARDTIQDEIRQSQQLTFKTVASIVALCVAVVVRDKPGEIYESAKRNRIKISNSKLRSVILESLYPDIKERKQLNTSTGRVIYNKIRAALLLFSKEQRNLLLKWSQCCGLSEDMSELNIELFNSEVLDVVTSYRSLTKILNLGKKKQKNRQGESNSQTTQATQVPELVSNKSLYNKVSTDLTHIVNLLEKAESLDGETLQMITSGVAKISEIIKAKTPDKKATKKVA